eukprot:jgi/Mesvir1/11333/Mv22248-RA.2
MHCSPELPRWLFKARIPRAGCVETPQALYRVQCSPRIRNAGSRLQAGYKNGRCRPMQPRLAPTRSQISERIDASEQEPPLHSRAFESDNVYGPQELVQESLFPLSLGTQSQESQRLDFDGVMWEKHRSVGRYFRTIRTIPGSRTLRALVGPTLWVGAFSVAVGAYEEALLAGTIDPSLFSHLATNSLAPLSLSGFALSLLLVFRTNTTYMRWLDARKMWGLLTSRSRNVMRQAVSWFEGGERDQELLDSLGRWTVAMCRTFKDRLQFEGKEGKLDDKLRSLMDAEGLAMLERCHHGPNLCLQVMTAHIYKAQLSSVRATMMDENLSAMEDIVASCERIFKTPIPLSYTRHTTRFLIIWATGLPLGLWHELHWRTPPVAMVITALLLGIEEIGLQLEEPFRYGEQTNPRISRILRTQLDVEPFFGPPIFRTKDLARQFIIGRSCIHS